MNCSFRERLGTYFPHLIALFTVSVWGSTFVSTKLLLQEGLTPSDIFFYRFLLGYLLIWVCVPRPVFARSLRDEAVLLLGGITGGSLYFLTENMALTYSMASNVSLIVCTTPLLTMLLLSVLYESERMGRKQWLGSLVACVGMALVVLNGHFILKLSPLGDLLAFAAAVLWACYGLALKMLEGRYSSLFVTRKVFFYGLITVLPAFLYSPLSVDWDVLSRPVVWGNLLFLGAVASMLCYFLWNIVVARLGAVRATNYIYFNPLVAVVVSFFVLDERITWVALLGGELILLGMYGAERR